MSENQDKAQKVPSSDLPSVVTYTPPGQSLWLASDGVVVRLDEPSENDGIDALDERELTIAMALCDIAKDHLFRRKTQKRATAREGS